MSKTSASVRLFLAGKGTVCEWRFDTGVGRARIMNEGDGSFLPDTFETPVEARQYCEQRLADDPALVFHIIIGEDIVDTVMDSEYHEAKAGRRALIYSVVSTFAIALVAFAVSAFVIRYETLEGRAIFVAAMVGLYLMLLLTGGRRNIDGLIAMIFVLLLAAILGSPIKELFEKMHTSWRSDEAAHHVDWRWCPSNCTQTIRNGNPDSRKRLTYGPDTLLQLLGPSTLNGARPPRAAVENESAPEAAAGGGRGS